MQEATKDHISLETAMLLKDCGVESKYYWVTIYDKENINFKNKYPSSSVVEGIDNARGYMMSYEQVDIYPAYTWQEILWEHTDKFFGKEKIKYKYNTPFWEQGQFIMMRQYNKMPKKWIEENEEREKNIIRPFGETNNPICEIKSNEPNGVIVAEIISAIKYLPKTFAEKHTNEILNFLQEEKYEDADKYFRKNTILIPKK